MTVIGNGELIIAVHPKGAELQSIYSKKNNIEYLWQAKPEIWAKHSPVLFPIVGALKNNSYIFNNRTYYLPRHGFARDKTFTLAGADKTSCSFFLQSDETTREQYPFDFRLEIGYRLEGPSLEVTYMVTNTSAFSMYFSIGGHPAFAVPLTKDTRYEDYYLRFDRPETVSRWPISSDGTIIDRPELFLDHENHIRLTRSLFAHDAIVLKNLSSTTVSLESDKTEHGVEFYFAGFPFLGLWAARQGDFVCIEPWCGIADSVSSSGRLEEKEGVEMLVPRASFVKSWKAAFF